MKAIKPKNQEQVDALMKIKEINKSGYAGILPNGNIVDRREHPTAVPIQKNPMFGIPEPKELIHIKCGCGGNKILTEDGLVCDICG